MTDNVVGQAYVELGILDKTKALISKIKSDMKNSLTGADLNLSLTDGMNDSLDEMTKQLNKIKGISLTNLVTGFRAVGDAAYSAVKEMGKISNVSKDLKFFLKDNKEITDYMRNGFLPLGQFKNVDEMKGKLEELIKTSTKLRAIRFATGKDYSTSDLFGGAGLQITRSSNALKSFVLKSADSFKYMRGQANLLGKSIKNTFMNSELGKSLSGFKSGIVSMTQAFAPLVATLGVVIASIAALTIAIKTCLEQAKKIDEIGDAADKIGTSYQSYAKYSKMGEVLGYEASDYESAFKKLRVSQAKGNEAFATLGISDAQAKSSTQLFEETVKKLQTIQDETERTRLAVEIFGKSATNITPLLAADSDEVDRLANSFKTLGAVVNETSVKRADTLENDIYMLKQAVEGFKNSMTGFIPVIDWVVSKLTLLIGYATVIMEVIFGISNATSDAADGMSDYSDSVSDAAETIEELKAGLRGFDELNNLTFNDETTENSLGLDVEDAEEVNAAMGAISQTMDETLQKIQAFRDWASGFAEEYGAIIPWLLLIVNAIIGTILCLTGHPILALPFFLAAGVGFAGIVSQISNTEDLDADGSVWDDYFSKLAQQFGMAGIFISMLVGIVSIIAGVACCCLQLWTVGIPLIIGGLALFGGGIALGFAESDVEGQSMWGKFFDDLKEDLKHFDWLFMLIGIIAIVVGVIMICTMAGAVPGVAVLLSGIALLGIGITLGFAESDADPEKSRWQEFFEGPFQTIKAWALIITQLLAGVAAVIVGFALCMTLVGALVGIPLILAGAAAIGVSIYAMQAEDPTTGLEDGWSKLIEGVKTALQNAWDTIKEKWSNGFGKIFTKEYWTEKWTNIKTGFINGFNTVSAKFEEWINGIIDKLNAFSFTMPEALGGKTYGFNLQHIQTHRIELATGGIVDNPGKGIQATVGEAGKEAILPLEQNTEWMDMLVKKINNDSDNRPVNITLEMDGKRVAQGVVKNINELTRSSGKLNLNFV